MGGRRVGKSLSALQEALKHCLSESQRLVYWIAPTYHLAKEVGFDMFMQYIDILKPVIDQVHHTLLKVTFINGSVIYFKSSDNPDSLRGRGLTLAILDEAAFCKEEVWYKIIRPALSDRNGKAIFTSTPNGHNWYKELYDNSDMSKYLWPTKLNSLISEDELRMVQSDISVDEFRQEYLAEFVTKAGRIYDEFTGQNIIDPFSPDISTYDIFLGMDFGYAHHTAIPFFAVDRLTGNKVIQFDELYLQKHQMDEIIKLIRIKLSEHKINQSNLELCYTDPAGNGAELSSGLSPVDCMRNAGFKIVNKGSSINAGIALVRAYLRNSLGEIRYYITSNCIQTIRSFNGYQYNSSRAGLTKEEPLKDNINDHMMDAVRYFFVNRFDHAKYVASTPTQTAYSNVRVNKTFKKCNKCGKPFISTTPPGKPPLVCNICIKG